MKETKIKVHFMALTENAINEKVVNGDEYISVKLNEIMQRFNDTGDVVKTNFLNFRKNSLLESLAVLNKDCRKSLMLCDENTTLKIASLVFHGAELTITRNIYEKGERSPIRDIELENAIIINILDINDNAIVKTDEDLKEDIAELIKEGKQIRKKADEEKAALKKAAKEALLSKLALAVEPEPELKDE